MKMQETITRGQPRGPAGDLQKAEDPDHRDRQLGRGPDPAGARGHVLVEHQDVERAGGRHRRQQPVRQRDVVPRRALERRIGAEGEKEGKAQVYGALLAVVDQAEIEDEGQRRGDIELEQRPRQRHREEQPTDIAAGPPSALVGRGGEILQALAGRGVSRVGTLILGSALLHADLWLPRSATRARRPGGRSARPVLRLFNVVGGYSTIPTSWKYFSAPGWNSALLPLITVLPRSRPM